jgi:tRNA pseudouridine38-40 synthase
LTTKYKIAIAYDGTEYYGWQVQPKNITVQERIRDTVAQITGEAPVIHGSGRTDQGVHARKQIAHFELEKSKTCQSLQGGLNALLPGDVRVTSVCEIPLDFHARRSAKSKEYRYFIWNADIVPPHLRLYRTRIKKPLDIPAMEKAAQILVGSHDFTSFTANARREIGSAVRNLTTLEIRKHGSEITIIAIGNGFLYKMVRSISGWLIRVGKGEVDSSETKEVLDSKQRTSRVRTAAPEGLFLWDVSY